jgi:Family of unknown function (DUF6090)
MVKVFRKKREKSINSQNVRKYFFYAFGEILLIVIGILIAIQIDNWNENRKEDQQIKKFYKSIHEEFQTHLGFIENEVPSVTNLKSKVEYSLYILNLNDSDSLPLIKDSLGAIATTWGYEYSFPTSQSFMNQEYFSEIKNEKIMYNFQQLKSWVLRLNNNAKFHTVQYQTIIEPFINSNINYTEIALQGYKKGLVVGGPKTDFHKLQTDMEFWNVLTFKLETCNHEIGELRRLNSFLETFDQLLLEELNKTN